MIARLFTFLFIFVFVANGVAQTSFVSRRGGNFYVGNKQYRFVGTNYWYGSLLGLEKDKKRGIERLRKELDFLKANGVTNLRLMAGAEGSGPLNGIKRVGPPLQSEQGKFDATALDGLDVVLDEMGKRGMKAVIFFSNNWEWSGGFQQYLIWNNVIENRWLTHKPTWDELRDNVAKFYSCEPCKAAYINQVVYVLGRRNTKNRKSYIDDPTIMAWEIANEPRPMRPAANATYKRFIADTAALIKQRDRRHLVTIGHEGRIGTESLALFEEVHDDVSIDYLTIHIWPKNWGWFETGRMDIGFDIALSNSVEYIVENVTVARKLNKPLVIEEFGLPRDGQSFDPKSPTIFRDRYFATMLSYIGKPNIAGANFWAFGGTARPIKGQTFWKTGDEPMGDPPMEEQGLNTVFDSDRSTWKVIRQTAARIK
jgi:mannan endo-1,4-beta-mannosidase